MIQMKKPEHKWTLQCLSCLQLVGTELKVTLTDAVVLTASCKEETEPPRSFCKNIPNSTLGRYFNIRCFQDSVSEIPEQHLQKDNCYGEWWCGGVYVSR
jgi:hypothetical protein